MRTDICVSSGSVTVSPSRGASDLRSSLRARSSASCCRRASSSRRASSALCGALFCCPFSCWLAFEYVARAAGAAAVCAGFAGNAMNASALVTHCHDKLALHAASRKDFRGPEILGTVENWMLTSTVSRAAYFAEIAPASLSYPLVGRSRTCSCKPQPFVISCAKSHVIPNPPPFPGG